MLTLSLVALRSGTKLCYASLSAAGDKRALTEKEHLIFEMHMLSLVVKEHKCFLLALYETEENEIVMKYIQAKESDINKVVELVRDTIKTIYPKYYPKEVVDFFCELHCYKNIAEDINKGNVGVLIVDNDIVGTGCYKGNHITRVYVSPEYQGKGYGSYIMECLEKEVALCSDVAYLDASLPACQFYEKRGYKTTKHETYEVNNGIVLVYEIMEKRT